MKDRPIVNEYILLWKGKHVSIGYHTHDGENAAFLRMFEDIDETGYYSTIDKLDVEQLDLYSLAKSGDEQAARELINIRWNF